MINNEDLFNPNMKEIIIFYKISIVLFSDDMNIEYGVNK